MRVGPQVQRPVDALGRPVLADRLGGGDDVVLVERRRQRGPAVPGGAERHPLGGLAGVGMHGVVGGDQLGHVHEILSGSGLPGARACHAAILACRSGRPVAPGARPCRRCTSRPPAAATTGAGRSCHSRPTSSRPGRRTGRRSTPLCPRDSARRLHRPQKWARTADRVGGLQPHVDQLRPRQQPPAVALAGREIARCSGGRTGRAGRTRRTCSSSGPPPERHRWSPGEQAVAVTFHQHRRVPGPGVRFPGQLGRPLHRLLARSLSWRLSGRHRGRCAGCMATAGGAARPRRRTWSRRHRRSRPQHPGRAWSHSLDHETDHASRLRLSVPGGGLSRRGRGGTAQPGQQRGPPLLGRRT